MRSLIRMMADLGLQVENLYGRMDIMPQNINRRGPTDIVDALLPLMTAEALTNFDQRLKREPAVTTQFVSINKLIIRHQ